MKTPKGKGDKPKTPPSPKAALTLPEIKAKMMEAVKKVRSIPKCPLLPVILGLFCENENLVFPWILQGVTLPKAQPKFENFLKNGYRVDNPEVQSKLAYYLNLVFG